MTLEVDGLLVDLDGCVWVGDEPLPGAVEALRALRQHGIALAFVTNDPGSTRATHAAHLTDLGVPVTPDEVVTASWALARTIVDRHPDATTFVLGPEAMRDELRGVEARVLPSEVDPAVAASADVVAVGSSPELGFEQLTAAVRAVLAGAELYTANRDPWFPMPDGPRPASGAFTAFVEGATGARAVGIGKPEAPLYDAARAQLAGAERLAVVGDRRDADIAGGRRAGLPTILVGPGHGEGPEPDHHVPGLADVPDLLGLTTGRPSSGRRRRGS